MSEIELCPSTCKKWHSKQFVAEKLGVSLSMVYRYAKNRGLRVGQLGSVYCPWIRAFVFKQVQDSSRKFKENQRTPVNR